MSLLASLPAPTKRYDAPEAARPAAPGAGSSAGPAKQPPPYGARQGFRPRVPEDYGNGGAFPEIHIAQYPLDMGRKGGSGANASRVVALTVDGSGAVNHDAILRQGRNAQAYIASDHGSLVPKLDALNEDMPRPDAEATAETARETAAALAALVTRKQASVNPATLPAAPGAPQYIRYTPTAGAVASGSGSRVIKMQDMAVDPLEPPKFRHTKVPRGAGDAPVPVLHSPPRALTAKDQSEWKIPPCISNWKNSKGYTIPLDKRLAADGRGLAQLSVNDNFAKLAEALYVTEGAARAAVDARARMQRELLAREKEGKERELRDLAARARADRMGVVAPEAARRRSPSPPARREAPGSPGGPLPPASPRSDSDTEIPREYRGRAPATGDAAESRDERAARLAREDLREERRRERERERRLEARGGAGKKSKLSRDADRDVSERVALGQARVTGGEAMYDQRLFNQDAGVGAGLGDDESYNLYDKPLFADRGELFRERGVSRHGDAGGGAGGDDAHRPRPDRGFSGADGSGPSGAPQFERRGEEADPFGLDAFVSDVRGGRREGPLGDAPRGGSMAASAGGAGAGGDGSRTMQFVKGSG